MDADRCCYCSRLPERRRGRSCRVQRCPLCKSEVGVAGSGECFRIAAAGPTSRRGLFAVIGVVGVVGVTALAIAAIVMTSERPAPAPTRPVATTVAVAPMPVRRDVAEPPLVLGVAKFRGYAFPRVQVKPNGEVVRGTTKPADTTSAVDRIARSKLTSRAPRTVVKSGESIAIRTPDWLRRTPSSLQEATLRNVREVGLARVTTKKELAAAFETVQRGHAAGSDKFLEGLVGERRELAGLPFLKGDACRLSEARTVALGQTSTCVRALLDGVYAPRSMSQDFGSPTAASPDFLANLFDVKSTPLPTKTSRADYLLPALMQILAAQPGEWRKEMIRGMEKLPPGDEASIAALVRLALYDPDADVRKAATQALQRESADKYGPKLLEGFRYPLPMVAEHAADAIVALERSELLPKLVDLLDEPDPAAPFEREEAGQKVLAVREAVKINHHRNCLVCHPPAGSSTSRDRSGLVARVPSPEEPLPPMSSRVYYDGRDGLPMIRANETYLRQDFTVMQVVTDHGNWPSQQRFDFLVRTRDVSSVEARRIGTPSADGVPSPHHRAVLDALTRLTSTYAGSRSSDWRAELDRRQAAGADAEPGR